MKDKRAMAKEILREIIKVANQKKTYYMILKDYWPLGNDLAQTVALEMGCTDEIWKEVYELNRRYERFRKYVVEIKPEWKIVKQIHYADNSIGIVEQNKWGEKRYKMIKAPSGDLCY
jgi:hypothetical protein